MKLEPNFIDVVKEQHGYFTTEQAERINGTSRKYINRIANNTNEIENVDFGIYRFSLLEESVFSDLIIMGLKANGKAAISHKSALAYWEMSDEVPYHIYMKVFDDYKRIDVRRCKDAIISTKGFPLLSETTNDYYSFGEFYITTPTRTLFDCVMDDCIQLESVKECLDSGKFNLYLLNEEQRKAWDSHSLIVMINEERKNNSVRVKL